MSGRIRIAQGGRKFAGVLPGPSGPLGKVGMYNSFYMRNILDSLPLFSAPLLTSLILAAGLGNPTYSRASIATVNDWEGIVRTVQSGEARFSGARRVQNLVTGNTEDATNAGWSVGDPLNPKLPATVDVPAPDGSYSACKWVINSNGGNRSFAISTGLVVAIGDTTTFSFWAYIPATNSANTLTSYMFTGGDIPVDGINLNSIPRNRWFRVRYTHTWTAAGAVSAQFHRNVSETIGDTMYVWRPQIENVTGQTNTAPGPYVSVGVLTAPFNGAGIDGVKYFDNSNGNTVSVNAIVTENSGTPIPSTTLLGYLAEGARTNLCLQSADFATTWVPSRATVSTNAIVAPDGSLTADKLVEDITVTNTHLIVQTFVVVDATTYTATVYAKAGERSWINLAEGLGVTAFAFFNVSTGTIGNTGGTGAPVASIQAVGNGWYRCRLTWTSIGIAGRIAVYLSTGGVAGNEVYTGDGASGAYLWGGQLEQNPFASSYIPTTVASVTRAEDVLSYLVSNMSPATGSCSAELNSEWTQAQVTGFAVCAGDATGRIFYNAGASNSINMFDGVTQNSVVITDTSLGMRKLANSWGSAGMKNCSSAGAVNTTVFDGSMGPGVNGLGIGAGVTGGNNWYGNIRNVNIYQSQLPDVNLQALVA